MAWNDLIARAIRIVQAQRRALFDRNLVAGRFISKDEDGDSDAMAIAEMDAWLKEAPALAERDATIERLEERCAAYKGQVEAGAAEIERIEHDRAVLREWVHIGTVRIVDLKKLVSASEAQRYRVCGELLIRAETAERERDEARAEVDRLKLTFFNALGIVQKGLKIWADKEHNHKWWRKIDGTPIPNDLCCVIAETLAAHGGEE